MTEVNAPNSSPPWLSPGASRLSNGAMLVPVSVTLSCAEAFRGRRRKREPLFRKAPERPLLVARSDTAPCTRLPPATNSSGPSQQMPYRILNAFRSTSSLRRGTDGLLFHGRYRLIGPAALIDQRSRCGFGISVQVRSPSRARAWYPCRREHSLLRCRNDGSDSPRLK